MFGFKWRNKKQFRYAASLLHQLQSEAIGRLAFLLARRSVDDFPKRTQYGAWPKTQIGGEPFLNPVLPVPILRRHWR